MIEQLSDAEIREYCRGRIESLELWLRRLIDGVLSSNYGSDYFDYVDEHGNRLIKKAISESLQRRVAADPDRYSRRIDAVLLDEAIHIACHPDLYRKHFRPSLSGAFPGGSEVIRQMLERMVVVRNSLSHANPISLHDAYQVICYSGDVIESLRTYYKGLGMNDEYNVPTIIKVSDSFGNIFHRDQLISIHDGGIMAMLHNDNRFSLRPGDILTVEIEVDPAFDPSTYSIRWASVPASSNIVTDGAKVVVPITNKHVAAQWNLQCRITSDKDWHRMGIGADDLLLITYKVLPPIS